MQRDKIAGSAADIACCERILQLYPWQGFEFRAGAWVRVPRKSRTLLTRERMRWSPTGRTPIQLLVGGKPLVDLAANWHLTHLGIGTMLFAGDIHVGGACWDMTYPGRKIRFCHPTSLDRDTALAEAMVMTPDATHSAVVRAAIERETISQHLWRPDARRHSTARVDGWVEHRARRALAGAIVKDPTVEIGGRRSR